MTVTVTLPVAAKVHDKVEVPEPPVTVVGLSVHATLSLVKATVLVKPPKGEIVIVDVAAIPTVAGTTVGLADMLQSVSWRSCHRRGVPSDRPRVAPRP